MTHRLLLPDLEIRSGAFGKVHRNNIYNVIAVSVLGGEPMRLTADALSANEFSSYVENLKKRLDTLVAEARADETKLRKSQGLPLMRPSAPDIEEPPDPGAGS